MSIPRRAPDYSKSTGTLPKLAQPSKSKFFCTGKIFDRKFSAEELT